MDINNPEADSPPASKQYRLVTPLSVLVLLLVAAVLAYQYSNPPASNAPICGVTRSASGHIELEGFRFHLSDEWRALLLSECQPILSQIENTVTGLTLGSGNKDEWLAKPFAAFEHKDDYGLTGFLMPQESTLETLFEIMQKPSSHAEKLGLEEKGTNMVEYNGVRCIEQKQDHELFALHSYQCKLDATSPATLMFVMGSAPDEDPSIMQAVIGSLSATNPQTQTNERSTKY